MSRLPQAGRTIPAQPVRCLARGNHLSAANDEPERPAPGDLTPADLAEIDAQFGMSLDDMRKATLL